MLQRIRSRSARILRFVTPTPDQAPIRYLPRTIATRETLQIVDISIRLRKLCQSFAHAAVLEWLRSLRGTALSRLLLEVIGGQSIHRSMIFFALYHRSRERREKSTRGCRSTFTRPGPLHTDL